MKPRAPIKNFGTRRGTKNTASLVFSVSGLCIALASLLLAYCSYISTRDFNSYQEDQGKPVFSFSDFLAKNLSEKQITQIDKTTKMFCDNFGFEARNVNDHPANTIKINSTVLYHGHNSGVKGLRFTDQMSNVAVGKDDLIGTGYYSYCLYLYQVNGSSIYITDPIWWHATITVTDAITKKTDSQEIYSEIIIKYNTEEDLWDYDNFVIESAEFDKKIELAIPDIKTLN